jgi:hypothetical protein
MASVMALVRAAGPRTRGRRFGAAAKTRIAAHVRERRAAGERLSAISTELGIPEETLSRWCRRPSGFVTVEVQSQRASALVVRGPRGLVIEGLDLDQVAELVRRLA